MVPYNNLNTDKGNYLAASLASIRRIDARPTQTPCVVRRLPKQ